MIYELRFDSERVVGYRGVGRVNRREIEFLVKSIFNRLRKPGAINLYLDFTYVSAYDINLKWVVKIYEVLYPRRLDKIDRVAVITRSKRSELPLDCPDEADVNLFAPKDRALALNKVIN